MSFALSSVWFQFTACLGLTCVAMFVLLYRPEAVAWATPYLHAE